MFIITKQIRKLKSLPPYRQNNNAKHPFLPQNPPLSLKDASNYTKRYNCDTMSSPLRPHFKQLPENFKRVQMSLGLRNSNMFRHRWEHYRFCWRRTWLYGWSKIREMNIHLKFGEVYLHCFRSAHMFKLNAW